MRFLDRNRIIIILLCLATSKAILASPAEINFQKDSIDLEPEQSSKLDQLITENQVFIIDEQSAKSKPRALIYNIERVRALKILQYLAQKGVDPRRIQIVAAKKGFKEGTITVSTHEDSNVPATQILKPAASDESLAVQEFRFYFPLGRAEFEELDEETYKKFLNSLGRPGNDVILIQGFTDTKGSVRHNEILSEFRALRVYEHLIRSGVPPLRIKTAGMGVAQSALENKEDVQQQAKSRQTLVSWVQDEEVRSKFTEPAAPKIEEPEVPEKKAEAQIEEEMPKSSCFVFGFSGLLMPQGDLKGLAKKSETYGLGFGVIVWKQTEQALSGLMSLSSESKHDPVKDDHRGSLNIRNLRFRMDYSYSVGNFKPFVGTGFDVLMWKGTITHAATARKNSARHRDIGILLSLGFEVGIISDLSIAPELSRTLAPGDFGEDIMMPTISLRWRI